MNNNPIKEYTEKQNIICRDEWFKDHKANLVSPSVEITVINWANPKSWNYGCRFIIHRRWLCVIGDIGEATFEWSQDITIEFLASLDFGYFLSKCRASPHGKDFEQWDGDVAWKQASDYIKELKETPEDDKSSDHDKLIEALDSLQTDGSSAREDYENAAREIYDATGDAELASMVSGWGNVPSCHAIGMFVGLQMAIAQLKEAK